MGKKYDEVMSRLDPNVIYNHDLLDLNDCDDCYDPEDVCMAFFAGFVAACEVARGADPKETVLSCRESFNKAIRQTEAVDELIEVLKHISKELADVDR